MNFPLNQEIGSFQNLLVKTTKLRNIYAAIEYNKVFSRNLVLYNLCAFIQIRLKICFHEIKTYYVLFFVQKNWYLWENQGLEFCNIFKRLIANDFKFINLCLDKTKLKLNIMVLFSLLWIKFQFKDFNGITYSKNKLRGMIF